MCAAISAASTMCAFSTANRWKFRTSSVVQFSHIQHRAPAGACTRTSSGMSSLAPALPGEGGSICFWLGPGPGPF